MHQVLRYLILITFIFTSSISFSQKNEVSIKFNIDNYESDTLLIGYYYGDRTLVLDTLYSTKKGKFILEKESNINPGVYLALYQPSNQYFQFIVPADDQKFTIISNPDSASIVVKNEDDNEIFNNYLLFIKSKSAIRSDLTKEMDSLKALGKNTDALQGKLSELDQEVQDKQKSIVTKYPNTITSKLLKSNFQINIPDYEGTEEEISIAKYLYYKSHYFQNIDLGDSVILRTPFIDERINYYIEKLTPQNPDSIAISIDYLLKQMEPAPETYRFYLSHFLNKYANSKIIGFDALYVYLIDHYYSKGKAPWVAEENMTKFIENANKIRPILIGEPAPPITFYKEDKTPVNLYDIDSKFTIMIFWAPDCGHCKKSMPGLIEFYNEYKDKGVEVLAICTKHRDKHKKCWEYIKDKELPFLNVGDEFHKSGFRDTYNVVSTPRIFILDENKKILLKRVPTKSLGEIIDALIIDLEKEVIDKK